MRFSSSVKKYDPDDEMGEEFETLSEAYNWCLRQQPYGFYSAWIYDRETKIEKRLSNITVMEINNGSLRDVA